MSPKKWIEGVNAVGITVKPGRYDGGTHAQPDIAFELASWVSAEFKLYIIQEYQKLKQNENNKLSLNWNLKREISKLNYKFHTNAIQDNLLPPDLSTTQINYTYANEADILNVAVFSQIAKEWRKNNPHASDNIRDNATYEQLLVLSNLESHNSVMIKEGIERQKRLIKLHEIALDQLKLLSEDHCDTNTTPKLHS